MGRIWGIPQARSGTWLRRAHWPNNNWLWIPEGWHRYMRRRSQNGTIGEVYFGTGRGKDAIEHLVASTAYAEKLVELSKAAPELLEAAVAHQVLGDVYGQPGTASLSDPAQAAPQYRRSIELDQIVLRKDPQMWRALRGIGVNHIRLGDLYRFTDPETAVEEYQQALRANDGLPPDELKRPVNARLRAQFLRKIGGSLRDLQQWGEAAPYLKRSLAAFEDALAADPSDKRAKFDLVVSLEGWLQFYELQGKSGQTNSRLDG
jgi:tetratricopeptide (TPR) repeat protein